MTASADRISSAVPSSGFPWREHLSLGEWRELSILLERRAHGMTDLEEARRLGELRRRAHPPVFEPPPARPMLPRIA